MNWCYTFSRRQFIRCPPRHVAVEDPLTQLLRRITPTHRRFIRCWRPCGQIVSVSFHATVGWTAADPSVHPVLKACLCLVKTWPPDSSMVPSNGPSVHPMLLSSRLLFSNSSDTTRKGTVSSSDGIKLIPVVAQCTKCSDAISLMVPSVHPTVSFSFFFFSSSTWIFASS
jgi:hypothetical protein